MNAKELIAQERQRQIEVEGWSAAHDDEHGYAVLSTAAAYYKLAPDASAPLPAAWPWDVAWWKPKERQRNLTRAGALYLAAAEVAERAKAWEVLNEMQMCADSCATLLQSTLGD